MEQKALAKQHIVIPARYNSSRLPGKLMMDLGGHPLLYHTINTAKSVSNSIFVATDSEEIFDYATSCGVKVLMTSEAHISGTDRIAEVAHKLKLPDEDIIVNLQGDEPFVPCALLKQVIMLLKQHSDAGISTLMQKIHYFDDFINPNVVKIAMGCEDRALYFSRSPIPFPRDEFDMETIESLRGYCYRHLGLYAYRVKTLKKIVVMPHHPLEEVEKLEQLRPLANGINIVSQLAKEPPLHGVDTFEDLQRLRNTFNKI